MMNIHVETPRTEYRDAPLCVDLDGTLTRTDTLWEGVIFLLKHNPFLIFSLINWWLKGRAAFKAEVARRATLDPALLPYNEHVLAFARAEHERGRKVLLVTGANEIFAQQVANHLGIFSAVLASSANHGNTGAEKRDRLIDLFGRGGFDYMGDSRADIAVFDAAGMAHVVNPDGSAKAWQKRHGANLMEDHHSRLPIIFKALRVHQWLKNTLVAVPFLLSHMLGDMQAALAVIVAFFSFSFMSSAVYILNDMMDLSSDRQHPRKKSRPLASGHLSIPDGLMIAAALSAASMALAAALSPAFLAIVVGYAIATTLYSVWLKRKMLVDVFTLAGLFTTRVIAGTIAVNAAYSYWLLAFSLFFFLSLALVKRYSELWKEMNEDESGAIAGRSYQRIDFEMIGQAGISSAFAASLVLALYIDLQASKGTYATPWILWPLCPLILFMLLRIWMLARRGFMDDDPLVFLLRDWRSQILCVFGALLVLVAAIGI